MFRFRNRPWLIAATATSFLTFCLSAAEQPAVSPSTVDPASEQTPASQGKDLPGWLLKPLSLSDCLNIALSNNSVIKTSQYALEAAVGQSITNQAIIIPKVVGSMGVDRVQDQYVENLSGSADMPTDSWSSSIVIKQQFFQGGRIAASLKVARHIKEEALYSHHAAITDTLTEVRIKFFDVLLAIEDIKVNEASVKLLENELQDCQRRLKAGVIPKFNVLRAEVQLANAQPPLIKARNDYRIAKNDLCNLLGYNIPKNVWEDIPLTLVGQLEAQPFDINLGVAMAKAIENRPELGALREAEQIAQQNVRIARSGYMPGISGYAGYQAKSHTYRTDLADVLHGWVIGGELSWNLFDGLYTKGNVDIAKANLAKSSEELVAKVRDIEVEVRSAYSNFIQAKETLESQMKNVELATEALRLANALEEAGSGTQLDVLDAETSLTEARTTWINSLRDYSVSLANLERAIGINIMQESVLSPSGDAAPAPEKGALPQGENTEAIHPGDQQANPTLTTQPLGTEEQPKK